MAPPRIREPSQRDGGFSDLALATFKEMLQLECECECDDGECEACREWWEKHRVLLHELELPPWSYPAVERPGSPCPYPEGSAQARIWEPDHEAQARWARLEAAVRRTGWSERVRLKRRPDPEPEMADIDEEGGG